MDFKPGHTVGIDLGTTYSTLAILDDNGDPTAIANDEDQVETPSLIVLSESGHVIVGPSRQRAAMEDPDNVVELIKREMGSEYKRMFDGREITPEFLSALILKKLKQDSEKRIGKIGNAVITVPYYFNDARRKATQDAGRIAGLNVIDIINEPTAATLTYAWKTGILGRGAEEEPRKALVYDLGGGTFDVTVVTFTSTRFRVLATDGDVQLGGVDWDNRLSEYVCEQFEAKHAVNPRDSKIDMRILRNDCDTAKMALSEANQAMITFRYKGQSIAVQITRELFEELAADLFQRTVDTTELVLEQAGVKPEELHAVVTVGGATLMPKVQEMLEKVTGKKPYRGLSPYTSVAQGAAIHAAILESKHRTNSELAEKVRKHLKSIQQENVNSHGLGVVVRHPVKKKYINHLMIPRNSRLPIEVKQTFKTGHEGQQRINVRVMEGDASDPAACTPIGNCYVRDLPPGLAKGSPVEVAYSFDTMGRVHVHAKDMTSGREAAIQIDRRGGLTEDQIDNYTRLAAEYKID
ncbi:MAG: Hsp70 family protein [Planctomycetia bacterium]|nr:Hsp70 family protein [Planctomycetia bacterium]